MPFGLVSRVGRGIGELNGGGDRRRDWAVLGVNVEHPNVSNEDCCIVILCREGWRRGPSQITLGFLVYIQHLRLF